MIVLLAACSPGRSNPRELGDCVPREASCSVSATGGVSSPSGDGGSAACSVNPADSQCTQCANASCCAALAACYATASCQNLMSCEASCGGYGPCVTACEAQYPGSVSTLASLYSCANLKCPVCSQLGVGDACDLPGSTCNPGLYCGGLWCTRACVRASDCSGLGAGGGNATGRPNACIFSPSKGDVCFAGCSGDADCSAFPGTYCLVSTSVDGLSVAICASSPDGGLE